MYRGIIRDVMEPFSNNNLPLTPIFIDDDDMNHTFNCSKS